MSLGVDGSGEESGHESGDESGHEGGHEGGDEGQKDTRIDAASNVPGPNYHVNVVLNDEVKDLLDNHGEIFQM